MKISFERLSTIATVTPLMCCVAGKNTLAATEGILIDAKEDGNCTFTTYDLEKGMITSVKADVQEAGSVIINAQKFLQTMKVMEGDYVELSVDSKLQAKMSCGASQHKMGALDGSSFPTLPTLMKNKGMRVSQGILKNMFSRVAYAMATHDERPIFNGCFTKIDDTGITMVSCDTFKIAKCVSKNVPESLNEDGSTFVQKMIIPVKTVNEITRMLSDDEESTIDIHVHLRNIIFDFENITMFSRLVDGEYIDYNRVIQTNHRIFVTANKAQLISALERAALITDERITGNLPTHVKLNIEENVIQISAVSVTGSTYDEVPIEHEGDNLIISFNNRYLIESLKSCDCETVKISLSSPLSSINIESTEGDECLFMLLPVRTRD